MSLAPARIAASMFSSVSCGVAPPTTEPESTSREIAAAWSELYKRECVLSVSPAVVLQRAAWKGTEVRRVAVEKGVWNKWNWREVTKEVRTLLTDLVYF